MIKNYLEVANDAGITELHTHEKNFSYAWLKYLNRTMKRKLHICQSRGEWFVYRKEFRITHKNISRVDTYIFELRFILDLLLYLPNTHTLLFCEIFEERQRKILEVDISEFWRGNGKLSSSCP